MGTSVSKLICPECKHIHLGRFGQPTMSRAALSSGSGSWEILDIDVALPGPGEVQVRVHAAALCHTDWDVLNSPQSVVLGHEGAGVVSAVGSGVDSVVVGQRVVLNWAIPCGTCLSCRQGRRAICLRNSPVCGDGLAGHAHPGATTLNGKPLQRSFHLGTLSEITVVRQEALTAIPSSLPMQLAALLGCGVLTGYGSAVHAAQIRPGEAVAVIGCGGVGLNVIQGARIAGATEIVAIDTNPSRLDLARRFGATHFVLARPDSTDLKDMGHGLIDELGKLADAAFECTANPLLAAAPLALIRHGGRAIQVSGVEQTVEIDCELFEWDKTYLNPLYGQCDPDRDIPALVRLFETGELLLDELISRTWRLDQLDLAFQALVDGAGGKNVILFD